MPYVKLKKRYKIMMLKEKWFGDQEIIWEEKDLNYGCGTILLICLSGPVIFLILLGIIKLFC